ncbi:hypothetical protein PpBr36_01990 [Pyricularia pennisetigena]|uniref:hypothetical protein n=1 Tax=Pyricularia pennisetigena TaxID=1578925 RepID=UPI00114D8A9F|nr:hypothetical protein PpBr36_01990 [Pyricularia pennisetigena]TLS29243.1 hypothetical protein PpBr36_01990 [Pyricularia pennisetigena]
MESQYPSQGSLLSPTNNTAVEESSSQEKCLKRQQDLSSPSKAFDRHLDDETVSPPVVQGTTPSKNTHQGFVIVVESQGQQGQEQQQQQQQQQQGSELPYQQPETPHRRRDIVEQARSTAVPTRPREADSHSPPPQLVYQVRRQFDNETGDATTSTSSSSSTTATTTSSSDSSSTTTTTSSSSRSSGNSRSGSSRSTNRASSRSSTTSISILPLTSSSTSLTIAPSTLTTSTSASPNVTLSLLPPAGGGNSTGSGPTTTVTIITGPPPSNAPSAATSSDERMSANLVLVVTFCAVFGAVLLIGTGIFLWKRARRRRDRINGSPSKGGSGGGGGGRGGRGSGGKSGKRSKYDGPTGSLYGDDPYATAAGEMEHGPVWGVTPPWAVADLPLSPPAIVLPPDPNRRMTLPGTMSRTLPKIVAQRASPTNDASSSNYPPSRSGSSAYTPTRGRSPRDEGYDPSNVI